jgi:RNA polymerase sigma-70 factor (ECF subfamily)
MQETMLACVESLHRFRGQSSFGTFLVGIARNQMLMLRRQIARDEQWAFVTLGLLVEVADDGVDSDIEDRYDALARAFRDLPLDLRIVLELTYWHRLPQPQIARLKNVPVGTIATRIRRAKELLRARLDEFPDRRMDTIESLDRRGTKVPPKKSPA